MYSINDFVYSMEYGIGCITSISNGSYTVKFEDQTIENVNPMFISSIHSDIISTLKAGDFDDYFNYKTVAKGHEYYNENRVQNVIILGKNINGSVIGTKNYSTSISISKNAIRSTCSCPLEKSCKHAVALLYKAQEIILKLTPKITKTSTSAKTITTNITRLINTFNDSRRDYSYDINNSLEFSEFLKNRDLNFYIELFTNLNNNHKNEAYYFKPLKRLIYFQPDFEAFYYGLKTPLVKNNFFGVFSREKSYFTGIINKIKNKTYTGIPAEVIADYLIANRSIKDAILELLNPNIYDSDVFYLISRLLDKVAIDDDIIDAYVNYITTRKNDSKTITALFMSRLNKEKFMSFYNRASNYIKLSLDAILNYPKEMQAILLKSVPSSNDKAKYILDNVDAFLEINKDETLVQLAGIYNDAKKTDKKKIYSLLSENNDSRYLLAYCKMLDGAKFDDDNFDSELFFKYFKPSYTIHEHNFYYDYRVDYVLKFLDDTIIDVRIEDDENYNGINKLEHKLKDSKVIKKIGEYLEKNDEEYKNKINEVREQARQKEIAEQTRYVNAIFDNFNDNDVVIYTNDKISLIPRIQYAYNDYEEEDEYLLGFKIGIEKHYVVKNVFELLDAINNSEVISYGKGLSFNHNIENFDDTSKQIIELLNYYPTGSIYSLSKQYLKITLDLLDKIFKIYKNKQLIFDDDTYLVRLNDIDISIKLDANNILHCSCNKDIAIITKNDIYLVNDLYIDRAKTNNNNRKIYSFAINNNDLDISLAKNRFRDEIYYRYKDYIALDEKIKDEYKIIDIDINAYFDYSNGLITVSEKLFKDDVELNLNYISGVDLIKYNNYKSYLKSLGFVNNAIPDKDMSLAFLSMDFTYLKELCKVFLSESIKNKIVYKPTTSNVRIIYDNSMLSVFVESSDFNEDELRSILKSVKKKKKYVLLKDNRIIDLNDENVVNFVEAIDDLGIEPTDIGNKMEIPIYQVLKLNASNESLSIDEYLIKIINELKDFKNYDLKLPNINAKLRGYQYDGFKWLSILSKYNMGGILADDMGLGKTLQIITLLTSDEENKPSIIVCPKSLIFNWIYEFSIFSPNMKVLKIYGTQQERANIINNINPNERIVYVTSYDSLRNDISLIQNINFNYAVIDEAQYIKNVQALKTKNVKLINASHRFALTGTPIENNVLDLWSIFDFIMPKYFEEIGVFKSNYLHDERYTEKISKMVAPFILRRTKKEVLKDLPNKFERIISAEMSKEQKKLYEAIKLEANEILHNGEAFAVLPYLTRLRQICVDPQMFVDNYNGSSGKMEMLKEIINEYVNDNHKILLFSSFVKALEIVKKYLDNEGIRYLVLTGDTKAEDRINYANSFNSDSNIKVFLISLKAGGTGLNLIGADTVIHLDPWWNVSAENQATDRAHRIGQTKNVEVIKIVCEDSIEQRVIELQNIKKDIIDKIISNDDTSITGFNLEDIGFILR